MSLAYHWREFRSIRVHVLAVLTLYVRVSTPNRASSYVWTCSRSHGDSPFSREEVWLFIDVTSADHPRCTQHVPSRDVAVLH